MPSRDANEPRPEQGTERIYYNSVYHHGLDEKRRIQIPAKWRPSRPDTELTLMIWRSPGQKDTCIAVLPPEVWERLVQKVTEMSFSDQKTEALRRWIGKNSDRVGLDKSGRICLPEAMAKAAAIDKEAVLVGLMDRFQIWNPERWEVRSQQDDEMEEEAIRLI